MSAEYTEPTINPGSFPPPVDAGHLPQAGLPASQQMKQRNGVLVWIVWPVLTLGIYHFVWYYKIHKEMLHFDPRQPIKPAGSTLTILFGWIIIVPPFVSYFNTGNRIAQCQRRGPAGDRQPVDRVRSAVHLRIDAAVVPIRAEQGRR
ncbi:MAG TPA: DUF4234 domain-containing protein [Nakamurella sp.]|nr:DUF4234 domain-containing protein [Nakamurella sp.]